MRVTVTARDIKNGEAGNGTKCPVARALQRALRTRSVVVGGEFYYAYDTSLRRPLTKKVDEFVREFDDGGEVEPFSFVIKRPKKGRTT